LLSSEDFKVPPKWEFYVFIDLKFNLIVFWGNLFSWVDDVVVETPKTIYDSGTAHNYGRFVTPITSVYKPGSYVAVMELGENYYYGGSLRITK